MGRTSSGRMQLLAADRKETLPRTRGASWRRMRESARERAKTSGKTYSKVRCGTYSRRELSVSVILTGRLERPTVQIRMSVGPPYTRFITQEWSSFSVILRHFNAIRGGHGQVAMQDVREDFTRTEF